MGHAASFVAGVCDHANHTHRHQSAMSWLAANDGVEAALVSSMVLLLPLVYGSVAPLVSIRSLLASTIRTPSSRS